MCMLRVTAHDSSAQGLRSHVGSSNLVSHAAFLPGFAAMRRKRGRAAGAGAYSQILAGQGGDASPQALEPLTPPVAVGPSCKSQRLRPRPPRTEPLPEGLDNKLMPDFVALAAASIPPDSWQALRRRVSKQPSAPITITVGTACAGSEFYLAALPYSEKRSFPRGFTAVSGSTTVGRVSWTHRSASGSWTTSLHRSCSRT